MKSKTQPITLALIALGAIAFPVASFADDATMTAPVATPPVASATTATAPLSSGLNPAASAWRPADESLDYTQLYNPTFNSIDLQQAKADHLSDHQVAAILKIAELTGESLRTILGDVERGQSFSYITAHYGLNGYTVRDVQKQKDEIAAYLSSYGGTGEHNGRRGLLQIELAKGNAPSKM